VYNNTQKWKSIIIIVNANQKQNGVGLGTRLQYGVGFQEHTAYF